MLKEGFYYDDYSHDTINANAILIEDIDLLSPPFNMATVGRYTFTPNRTPASILIKDIDLLSPPFNIDIVEDPISTAVWNSSTNTLDIDSGDNDSIYQTYANTNLPNSGYAILKFHVSYSYSIDISIGIRIREDATNYYKAQIDGNSYSSEYISKYVGGVETDAFSPQRTGSIVTVGGDSVEDIDVEIEFWWSPTYLKLMIDGANEMELDCTNNTSELDIANIYIDWFQGDYEIEEMIVSYYTPKIGADQLINSKSFNEVGPIDGLINYWPMNGHLKDYGEGNNDGTASGATIDHAAPRDKMCYDFTDLTDAVNLDADNPIECNAGENWSWSCWIYKTAFTSNNDGIAGHHQSFGVGDPGGEDPGGFISFHGTTPDISVYTTTNYSDNISLSGSIPPTSEWFHFCVTHNSSNLFTFYINGTSAGSVTLAGDINISRLGDNPSGSSWDSLGGGVTGLMFDFRIYNKVLSTQKINILSEMFYDEDNPSAYLVEMKLDSENWYVFGEIKEQL